MKTLRDVEHLSAEFTQAHPLESAIWAAAKNDIRQHTQQFADLWRTKRLEMWDIDGLDAIYFGAFVISVTRLGIKLDDRHAHAIYMHQHLEACSVVHG